MNNWKHYAGSILLAGLLLQGCSSTEENDNTVEKSDAAKAAQSTANTLLTIATSDNRSAKLALASGDLETSDAAENFMKEALATLVANGTITQAEADAFMADNDLNQAFLDVYAAAHADNANTSAQRSVFSKLGDKIKDGLVDVMDSKVGDAITGAAFDVVLNSEGVTVFMLDQARNSETMTQIMIDALDANWDLTKKMCPMLQTNAEFGEKFAALAEERESMAHFFFQSVDANMYGCLTDAMLLSNNDDVHHESVSHSTNAYMGILLDRYATRYFIQPDQAATDMEYGEQNRFASLMFNTQTNVEYNSTSNTFENHGDGNELINEQFFYSLFKTPGTTESFVTAMEKVKALGLDNEVYFMDKIFLGANSATDDNPDTVQGYLNIISIGSAMYDGIYGEKNAEGTRVNAYGFGSYTNAFIGFAGLIPSDRYLTYGKAFIDAGYAYAQYNGLNVWEDITNTAQDAWDNYTTPAATPAPARSAGLGTIGSDWLGDITDLFTTAWSGFSLTAIYDAFTTEDESVIAELKNQANIAYDTVLDGRDETGALAYITVIENNSSVYNDEVYGFHGLIELAMQEDIYYTVCGNRSTDHIAENDVCDNNSSYTMDNAKAAFTLPPFADITWAFAYNSAMDGATAYYNNFVDAGWLADLSTNELVREYFYPSADNVYIPSWLLAIDWLKLPDNVNNAQIAETDFDFDAGYLDIYVASTNPDLVSSLNLPQAADPLKTIEMVKIEMGDDSIIAVDANGQDLAGLYIYKVRVVSPEDTAAVLAYLNGLGDDALAAIGIDSDNAAQTVAAAE